MIGLAHPLGLTVIAEGVETDAHAALLRAWGCEQGQGYLFARPMSPARMIEWRDAHVGATAPR